MLYSNNHAYSGYSTYETVKVGIPIENHQQHSCNRRTVSVNRGANICHHHESCTTIYLAAVATSTDARDASQCIHNGTSITSTTNQNEKSVLTPTVSLLNQKLKHIDAVAMNEQMGLAIRFHFCAKLCNSTKLVMHVDDDMEFSSHSVINTLIRNMLQNPKRIVGHYGRTYSAWTAPFRHGYDTRTVYGNVEVVLTKILILEQKLCQQFFKYTHLVTDILNRTTDVVKWNGEDIFINLIANYFYHVPKNGPYNNYAIPDLDVWDVDTSIFDTMNDKRNGIVELSQQLRGSRKDIAVAPASTTEVILENAVSGNMDRNRIWNVGFYQWLIAYQKAQSHTKFRGMLWYTTKQRLYKQSTL
jgi:Glycosyl transferase family 64 domain